MAAAAKKFDPNKPYGTVHGSPTIAFFQDGEHFDATGAHATPPDAAAAADNMEAEVRRRVDAELDTRVAAAVAAALAHQKK